MVVIEPLILPSNHNPQTRRRPRLYFLSGRAAAETHHLRYSLKPFFKKYSEALLKVFPEGMDFATVSDDDFEISSEDYLFWFQPQQAGDDNAILVEKILPRFLPRNTAIYCYDSPAGFHFRRWIFQSTAFSRARKIFSPVALLADGIRHHWIPPWNYLLDFESGISVVPCEEKIVPGRDFVAINPIDTGLEMSAERIEIIDYFIQNIPKCRLYGKAEHFKRVSLGKWLPYYAGELPYADSNYRYVHKIPLYHQAKFVVVIENLFADGYMTEKLAEPLAALSLPVYFGDPGVCDYLPNLFTGGIINGHEFANLDDLKTYLEKMSEEEYQSRLDTIRKHRSEYFEITSYRLIWDFVLAHVFSQAGLLTSPALEYLNRRLIDRNAQAVLSGQRDQLLDLVYGVLDMHEFDRKMREVLWLQASRQAPYPYSVRGPVALT